MERVVSAEQYRRLTAENRARFSRVDSSCVQLAGELEPLLAAGRLYYELYEGGLCFFADEGRYYDAYPAWDRAAPLENLRQDRPVLVSAYNGAGQLAEKAAAAGARRHKVSRLYEADLPAQAAAGLAERYGAGLARLAAAGVDLVPCGDAAMAEQTACLWLRSLDLGDVPEDHLRFLENPDDRVVCAVKGPGQVVGAYWWRRAGRNAEGRHVVTREDSFRQGIGSALLLRCMTDLAAGGAKRLTTWISDDNSRSIALHEGVGFRAGGRYCVQYIF